MRIKGPVDAATLKTAVAGLANGLRRSGERERIATGHTDVRRSMNLLAFPPGGDLYVFRGKSGKLIKILWQDGFGTCRSSKRR